MNKKFTSIVIKGDMRDKSEEDISLFYKNLIKKFTNKNVEVWTEEISNGKYGVHILEGDKVLWIISKCWDSTEIILENIKLAAAELNLN